MNGVAKIYKLEQTEPTKINALIGYFTALLEYVDNINFDLSDRVQLQELWWLDTIVSWAMK